MFAIVLGFEVKNLSFTPLQRRILEVIKTLNENRKHPGLITAPNGTQAWCNAGPTGDNAILVNINAGCVTNKVIATAPAQMHMALLELYDSGFVLSANEVWEGNAVVAYRLSKLGEMQFRSGVARFAHRVKEIALNPSGLSRVFYAVLGGMAALLWAYRQIVVGALVYLKKLVGL